MAVCLRLTYAEALLWKRHAAQLVADAKAKAAAIPCDPLFGSNLRLSSLVSEVDGIKKRHGLLIERALIFAINQLPHWEAAKEPIAIPGGKAHLDCLAFNAATQKLYIFECKRGHGRFDSDKVKSIDQRLDTIGRSIGDHARLKEWHATSTDIFILSFYGGKWRSKYPIYDRHSIARLFDPCVGRFVIEYMSHIEAATTGAYSDELKGTTLQIPPIGSIFDLIEESQEKPWPDVLFNANGAEFIPSEA